MVTKFDATPVPQIGCNSQFNTQKEKNTHSTKSGPICSKSHQNASWLKPNRLIQSSHLDQALYQKTTVGQFLIRRWKKSNHITHRALAFRSPIECKKRGETSVKRRFSGLFSGCFPIMLWRGIIAQTLLTALVWIRTEKISKGKTRAVRFTLWHFFPPRARNYYDRRRYKSYY